MYIFFSYFPGFRSNKINYRLSFKIIYTFNFTAKTYVYGPVMTSKQITKAEVKTYADLKDQAPDRVQKITTTVTSGPDADDNFGFNETTSEWV